MKIDIHALKIIVVVALVTIAIRFAPFILFRKKVPNFIHYLGKKLPYAIMAMLVVYCLKDTSITNTKSFLATSVGVCSVVVIHLYKRNILLSIVISTVLYMLFLNLL